jgi:hypothetical protein
MTTLDTGKKDTYQELGNKSSLRYNKIKNFVLYGIPRFNVDLNLEEFGIESNPIEGEAIILPNTIIPSVDDYFTISYIPKPYLFRITKQTIDTVENNSDINFYKVSFVLDTTRDDFLKSLNGRQLVNTYTFDMSKVGTNMTPILTEEESDGIASLQSAYDTMMRNYKDLFWKNNVQAFICGHDGYFFIYDPYLTEFIIRNDLFYNNGKDNDWIFVDQAVHKSHTFNIEYANTIFNDVENRNPNLNTNSAYAIPVHDPNSLLTDRLEEYMELSVNIRNSLLKPINNINMKLFDMIEQNTPFNEDDTANPLLYWNIIINWMNDDDYSITAPQLNSLLNLKYMYSKDLFYHIPLLMFIIKQYIAKLQTTVDDSDDSSKNNHYLEPCYNTGK